MVQDSSGASSNGNDGVNETSKLIQPSWFDDGLTNDDSFEDEAISGHLLSSAPGRPPSDPKSPPPPPSSHSKVPHQTSPSSASASHLGGLDFEKVVNEYSIQAKQDLHLTDDGKKRKQKRRQLDSRSITRWALTIGCSLSSGLTSVVVVSTCERIVQWRTTTLDRILLTNVSVWTVFAWYALGSLVLADVAAILCVYWVPEAAGSGIPEVKASLNGVRVRKFNSPSLFVVKMVGSVLSVASSLAVGMEGPLVFIGAIVGASMAHVGSLVSSLLIRCCSGYQSPFLTRLWIWSISDLSYFANDSERRDLITVGAACGFAASFGAPIGGLLFVLEDLSSFFDRAMFLRVLVANTLGTFCLALYRGDLSRYGSIQFGTYNVSKSNILVDRLVEVPFWILLGIGGGVLGGLFAVALAQLKQWSAKRFDSGRQHMMKISYVSLGTSAIMFFLPTMKWVCHDVDAASDGTYYLNRFENDTDAMLNAIPPSSEDAGEGAYGRRFFCDAGQINEMATIMFGSRNQAIVRILSNPGQFYPLTLFLVGIVFYVLMCITNTTQIPCGTFTPTVLIGASFGGAMGILLEKYVHHDINPSTFALLGVAALMAGIQRSTISVCVILVEGTGQIRVLLPVMIVVVTANSVAQVIKKDGIYETLIKLKGYPYLQHSDNKGCYDLFEVHEIMCKSFVTLRERERVSKLVRILKKSRNNGFPVVDSKGKLKGLVRRQQIVALIECGIFEKSQADDENACRSSTSASPQSDVWSPKPGVASQPLMHWAFHIKDDRYDVNLPPIDDPKDDDFDDDFDADGFLFTVHTALNNVNEGRLSSQSTMTGLNLSTRKSSAVSTAITDGKQGGGNRRTSFLDANALIQLDSLEREFAMGGSDTMPSIDPATYVSTRNMNVCLDDEVVGEPTPHGHSLQGTATPPNPSPGVMGSQTSTSSVQSAPTGFARVGRGPDGDLMISWLNPSHRNEIVNLQAVMNRGTYSVPEYFPLSKVYKLFTTLGLRWIVLVGESGRVVGMVNRESLLESHVKEKTGIDTSNFSFS